MDRQIKKSFWSKYRIGTWLGVVSVLLVVSAFVLKALGFTHEVSADRLSISAVKLEGFKEVIPVNGTVEPITSIMVNTVEGGRVEEVFVQEGATVVKGDALLRLSNTAVSLDFMNRETQIIEQINNLRSTRIALLQNQRQSEDQLIEIENQLKIVTRQYKTDTLLASKKAISDLELFNSERAHEITNKKFSLAKTRAYEDERYRRTQIARIDGSIELMERNLDAIRKNLENLVIKAPLTGQLNSFDHELGATLQRGQNVGRVDNLESFKVSALVDQYYLNRVRQGLEAEFDYGGHTYSLTLSKVSPTVAGGQFEVEFNFGEERPENLTRGQLFQVRISLSAESEALLVPKGAFFQSSGGKWMYVLDQEGKASQRPVELGRQNTKYIEVLGGLQNGERVITSSYEAFKEHQDIKISQDDD